MLNFIRKWFCGRKPEIDEIEWTHICTLWGKWKPVPDLPHAKSASMYWCYYNEEHKKFRINVDRLSIVGKYLDSKYPDEKFFQQYMFEKDIEKEVFVYSI